MLFVLSAALLAGTVGARPAEPILPTPPPAPSQVSQAGSAQAGSGQAAGDAESVYRKALPSVLTVEVTNRDGSRTIGSGFLALAPGLAVTAWHVVEDAKSIRVRFSDGEEFESTGYVDRDEARDVAIVRVRTKSRPMLRLAPGDPPVGAKTYVIGAPEGLEFSIGEGIVAAIRKVDGGRRYQYTAPTHPGNSGGPVLDSEARVLGVVSYGLGTSETLNFATPAEYVDGFDTTLATRAWGTQPAVAPSAEGTAGTSETEASEADAEPILKPAPLPPWTANLKEVVDWRAMETAPDANAAYRVATPRLRLADFTTNALVRKWASPLLVASSSSFLAAAEKEERSESDVAAGWTRYYVDTETDSYGVTLDAEKRVVAQTHIVNVETERARDRWNALMTEMQAKLGRPSFLSIERKEGKLLAMWAWDSGYSANVTMLYGEREALFFHAVRFVPPEASPSSSR